MRGAPEQPKDYPDPLDEPDPFDPTGYYARKSRKNAEMLPLLAALFVAMLAIVVVSAVTQIAKENIMIGYTVVALIALFVGWNVPQPAFAIRAENWARRKLGKPEKEIRLHGTGSSKLP